MARADLLCDLIKSGIVGDIMKFRKATEAICAEERAKQHDVLAKKIEDILNTSTLQMENNQLPTHTFVNNVNGTSLFQEIIPEKHIEQLILSDDVKQSCNELVEEQLRSDLLRSYGVEPRNKVLLVGPPGNGKTSLAEAIATSLMVPLYVVRYETLIGAYLGETASKLAKLFEYVKTRQCVLLFDEFETLGKERGDQHETGEIKRVVSSLLLQIDALPSYAVVVAATNHETLLDQAAWRRFQIRLELKKPTRRNLEQWFLNFQNRNNFDFGIEASTIAKKLLGKSYAEAEEFALSVYRQFILHSPCKSTKSITLSQLRLHKHQVVNSAESEEI